MTILKRVGMLVAALIAMAAWPELGEQLHPRGSSLVSSGGSCGRPAADAGQRCRRGTAVGAALCGRRNLLARADCRSGCFGHNALCPASPAGRVDVIYAGSRN